MSGDILRIEAQLLPRTLILFDDRVANARFMKGQVYRNCCVSYNQFSDVTVFELQEPSLGKINIRQLEFCLGKRFLNW